ncbi:4Fe-4S binding protein [Aequorivita echinoideorum]|uniref:4Fe-4S binding protein n=1 Tax=Aequorivita echinoideorum TaxID=1549647 RepID=A0ABS5S6H9_9FLAO|nr:4Fe-4S dicluster domain-containing protein [Aequorivita echinoideorum]MBT0607450.1 4Fe-4S binding protein [Aequorivita echinoideorum]
MGAIQNDMSLSGQPPVALNALQKIGTALGITGLTVLLLAAFNINLPENPIWFWIAFFAMITGVLVFTYGQYKGTEAGIKNDGVMFKAMTSRGFVAWVLGIALTVFYIILYWFPNLLGVVEGGKNTGVVSLFDPLSEKLTGGPSSQWFVYGVLYTLAILLFGIKFIWKYRHNRYEIIRTCSVMFFQLCFAFMIPNIMGALSMPSYDLKNIWPLNYDLFSGRLEEFTNFGSIGTIMLIFGLLSIFVITPILTYKYGKRWYCSWVCGCGGLAETAGDPYRHLSDKRMVAWKIERWVVHSVVVFVTVMTVAMVYSFIKNKESESIGPWNNFEKNIVFVSERDGTPLAERGKKAAEAGASRFIYVDREGNGDNISFENMGSIGIPFHIISYNENAQVIKQIEEGVQGTLLLAGAPRQEIVVEAETGGKVYDDVWLDKGLFIWLVVTLLTLVFGWAMIFRREQLAKDAKLAAISYFTILISLLLYNHLNNTGTLFLFPGYQLHKVYGFLIGAVFSGVIGVGFYPIFGSRVWCRFGCPMAAILGFQQRLFSRFRITTNGGQCISCGNCSTYCEMGIDVRAYAQKGENIVRSSCVGCGICSAVCPRGVLKLENGPLKNRINSNEILLGNDIDLMNYVNK